MGYGQNKPTITIVEDNIWFVGDAARTSYSTYATTGPIEWTESATVETFRIVAPMVQVRYRASDAALLGLPTEIFVAEPTRDTDSGSHGLSTGARVGVGVGISLGIIGLVIGAFFLWRRRQLAKEAMAFEPELDATGAHLNEISEIAGKASDHPPFHGLDRPELDVPRTGVAQGTTLGSQEVISKLAGQIASEKDGEEHNHAKAEATRQYELAGADTLRPQIPSAHLAAASLPYELASTPASEGVSQTISPLRLNLYRDKDHAEKEVVPKQVRAYPHSSSQHAFLPQSSQGISSLISQSTLTPQSETQTSPHEDDSDV